MNGMTQRLSAERSINFFLLTVFLVRDFRFVTVSKKVHHQNLVSVQCQAKILQPLMPCRRIDFYQNFLGNSCLSFHKEVSLSSLNTEHEVRSLYPTVYILNFRFNILNGCYPLGSFNQKFLPVNLDVKKSKRCEFFKIFIGKSTAVKKVRVSDLIKKEQHLQKY